MRTLETERLILRAFVLEDGDAYARLLDAAFGADSYGSSDAKRVIFEFQVAADAGLALLHQPPYGDRAIVLRRTGDIDNTRSIAVMRRLGMRVERTEFLLRAHEGLQPFVASAMTRGLPAVSAQLGRQKVSASLFDRLGGKAAITAVVVDFRTRVAKDARINEKFARTDIPRLDAMLIDQVCEATGGPCRYTGRNMRDAHQGMKVTTGEFNALVEDLVATLNAFKVPKAEQDELLGILGPLKTDIVEVESTATGTPLPDGFKAAPPLARA